MRLRDHGIWGRVAGSSLRARVTESNPGFDLFHLRTARDRWLAAGPQGHVEMAAELCPQTALMACIPTGGPQTSFLVAPDAQPLTVEGDGFTGPAISARLRRVPGGQVELRHPLTHVRYLGVVFTAPAGRPERVMFDRVGHAITDRFDLHAVAADTLPKAGRMLLAELADAAAPPMGADRLMQLLATRRIRMALAEALMRVLPADELQVLARRLMDHPADLVLLRRAMPADPWLNTTLPALIAWRATNRPATRRAISPATDEQASLLQSGALRPQLGLALTSLARCNVPPRRVAAVLATARNEGAYLLDWLAHHRAIGFDHAVIYSNDNDDGSDDLLGLLADRGEITWVRNELAPHARAQWKAYGHAFKMLPDLLDYRWTMVLDLDEYVGFRVDMFGSVADLIGWHEHQLVDAIALRWLNFYAGPQDVWRDAPSTQRFTQREPGVSPLFKSLVRSNRFWDSHCHFPFSTMGKPFAYCLEDGATCHHIGVVRGEKMPPDPVTAHHAWVAHHVYRSAAEALMKVARGDATWRADMPAQTERRDTIVQRFVGLARRSDLVRDDRTLACAPGLDDQRARLAALPGVAVCDQAIKRVYASRLREASQAFLDMAPNPERPAYVALHAMLASQ